MSRGKPDFILMFILLSLIGFGLVMVFSSSFYFGLSEKGDSYYYFKRQLAYAVLAVIALVVCMNINYKAYRKLLGLLFFLTVILLITVFFMPPTNGARRWIYLGSFSFQPSEIARVTAVMYAAHIFSKKQDRLQDFWRGLLPPLIVIGLLFLLIVFEPHFSSALILFCACTAIVFCAGVKKQHLFFLGAASVPILIGFLLLKGYRVTRLHTFLDPFATSSDQGFQTVQSLYAIAPGGWTGVGLGNSIQKMLYLPEAHTDFIFSIIAEELGFLGSCLLILFYFALFYRGLVIALRAPDQFGLLLAVGLVTLVGVQVVLNIAVATALVPVTGVTLPFISYGGTSLVINAAIGGILLNISRHRVTKQVQKRAPKNKQPEKPRLTVIPTVTK